VCSLCCFSAHFIPMMLKFKRTWETLGIPQRHRISYESLTGCHGLPVLHCPAEAMHLYCFLVKVLLFHVGVRDNATYNAVGCASRRLAVRLTTFTMLRIVAKWSRFWSFGIVPWTWCQVCWLFLCLRTKPNIPCPKISDTPRFKHI